MKIAFNRKILLASVLAITLIAALLMQLGVTYAQNNENPAQEESHNEQLDFSAVLTGNEEVPPVTTEASGEAEFALDSESDDTIAYTIEVAEGENITAAHLHCAPRGENGPVVVTLFSSTEGVDINGELVSGEIIASEIEANCEDITNLAELIDAMESEQIYVNVHSVERPNGLIRGQVEVDSDTLPDEDGPYTVMVMKHLCNDEIESLADFEALEAGKSPVNALVATVLACPTTGLPGDEPVSNSVAVERTNFEFKVQGIGMPQYLDDAEYKAHSVCESDVNLDADGNGTIATSTCLDISHYEFTNLMSQGGKVTVQETETPDDTTFGAVRFTPTELATNNDEEALEDVLVNSGTIKLDLSEDDDGMVMLHVYNFQVEEDDDGNGNGGGLPGNDIDEIRQKIQKLREEISKLRIEISNYFREIRS